MTVRPYGDRGLLIDVPDIDAVLPLASALRTESGVVEAIPAARTVLVEADAAQHARLRGRIVELLAAAPASAGESAGESTGDASDVLELSVRYDGADLFDTAAELGLDTDALVRRHTAVDYVVAFCGFAPGFGYLRGLDPALHVGRLAEPRTRVPSGSVGIAGEFTGVYPRESPGGWRLLGRTDADLWNVDRDPPALLTPGTRVRFTAG